MRTRFPIMLVAVGTGGVLVAGCSGGSSGGAAGPHSGESGGATLAARTGDCGMNPEFNIDAHEVAGTAGRAGVGRQSTPRDALRAVLTHGSMPYFGGSGGSGVVGLGYPATGWTAVPAGGGTASFRAPLHSGTATLTFTRVGGRWLLSHAEKDC